MTKSLTLDEVRRHNTEKDAWIVVDGLVYDVTKFIDVHPGGRKILAKSAGTDATKLFKTYHTDLVLEKYGPKLLIGKIANVVEQKKKPGMMLTGENEVFGDLAPFCEPSWYQDWYSPYYNESHRKLRRFIRDWCVKGNWLLKGEEWEKNGKPTPEGLREIGEAGILRVVIGTGWPEWNYPGIPNLPMNISPKDWDIFHEMIVWDELIAYAPAALAVIAGSAYALPPILVAGNEKMKAQLIPEVLSGKKVMALAITEPHAGSDVQGITATATLSEDGKYYIVNGEKKWITSSLWSQYLTVAVRTGGKGGEGISLLLVEVGPGVDIRRVETQTGKLGGTGYVVFEDCKVPVENVIGKVNQGFKAIMHNFNHERLTIVWQALRQARICFQDALHYAHKRKTFGKNLVDHPVIRDKFAQMARQIEATAAWNEHICYQVEKMPKQLQPARLGGAIALLKVQSTKTFELCAIEASQIMGGISLTKGGQGGRVESLYRSVRAMAIPGGSQEILSDLGVRQSLKVAEAMGANL